MRKVRKSVRDARSSPHTKRGEARKETLISAAYDTIAERGFEGLRTRAVAARASLNVSTLHYYFPTKEDLVRGVAARLLREFKNAHPASDGEESPLRSLAREFTDQSRALAARPATYVVALELYARSLRDPLLRPIARDLLSGWEKRLGRIVAEAARRGEIDPGTDQAATVKALQSLLLGRSLRLLITREDSSRGGGLRDAIFPEVSRWLSFEEGERRKGRDRSIT